MTVLVDGNSRGHAHHDSTKLTVAAFQTQAIFGLVKEARSLAFAFPTRRIVVLWDGRAQWRYDLYPGYKAGREGKSEVEDAHRAAYKAQVPWMQQALRCLGVNQLLHFDSEADDLAGYMAPKIAGKVLLLTGDQDWLQLVSENVTWLDPRGEGRKVTPANFFEFTGYQSTAAFLDGKCLQGDSSDKIDGVGIGKDSAPAWVAEFGSVQRFYDLIEAGKYTPKERKSKTAKTVHPEQYLASPEGRAHFARNRKLMNLLQVPAPTRERYKSFKRDLDIEGFRRICEKLAFISILKDFDNFTLPFRERAAKQVAVAA